MRIGIDARFYGPSATGIGIYTEELIRHLLKIDKKNHYVIFLKKEGYDDFSITSKNVEKVLMDIPHYSFQEQLFLNSYLNNAKLDFVHFAHFNKPIAYRRPYIVTIHDLTLLLFPATKNILKQRMFTWVLKSTAKNARKIITISENAKKDIVKYLDVSPSKVKVIYLSVSSGFKPEKRPKNIKKIRQRFEIKKPYLIYAGQQRPHKNLVRLVEAFAIFKKKYQKDLQLVFVGKKNPGYPELPKKVSELNLSDDVIFTGFLEDHDLVQLYSASEALVFPSLYEGFGIPPLEAMASGVPTIVSNASCIPEILGDAAYYFDPKNPANMAEAIDKVLSSEKIKKLLIEKGIKLVKKYTWFKAAKETLVLYENFGKTRS